MPDRRIKEHEYQKMQRRLAKLEALEQGGVDNWYFHDDALTGWYKENEIEELIDDTVDEFNDILAEADVDQPAGAGCGYNVTVNPVDVGALLKRFGTTFHKIQSKT